MIIVTNFIDFLAKNSLFLVITGVCSVISVLLGVPPFRKKIGHCIKTQNSKKTKIGTQTIIGDNNQQSGGSIYSTTKINECSGKKSSEIKVQNQTIIGSGNKQSGRNIHG